MQITQNTHLKENIKNTSILIRIPDVDLFPAETILSCQTEEPNDLIINELFERRLNLMRRSNEFLKTHDFRVFSRIRVGIDKFCIFWMAKMQYLQDFHFADEDIFIKKNQICFFHGRFTFWRVGSAWQARIC